MMTTSKLTTADLRFLNAAYRSGLPSAIENALVTLGNPTRDEIVGSALLGLDSADRNERVLMLRTLARYSGDDVTQGLLRGMEDDQRRVRGVAVRSCRHQIDDPRIVDRLATIVSDGKEKRKIRHHALDCLTGQSGGRPIDTLPEPAVDALARLAQDRACRSEILFRLLRLNPSSSRDSLLRALAADTDPASCAMATKALHGFVMVNLGEFTDEDLRRQIVDECESATGRVYYWVRRDLAGELRAAGRAVPA